MSARTGEAGEHDGGGGDVKCPLLTITASIQDANERLGPVPPEEAGKGSDCREGDCAWWDSRSEHCAVHVLAWAMTESIEAQARRVDRYEESH